MDAVLDNAGRGSRCCHVLGRSKACLVGLSQSQQLCPLLMLWTAPNTGIAMCQNAVEVAERLESAYGYNLPSEPPHHHVRSSPNSGPQGVNVWNLDDFVRSTPRFGSAGGRLRTGTCDPQRKSRFTKCDPLHQRLQPLRYLHDCSDCFRLEQQLPGGTRTH